VEQDCAKRLTIPSAIPATESPELPDGSGSRYTLPTVPGRHTDLKSITPETLARLLEGNFGSKIPKYYIVDARYPYEYDGGHVISAANLHTEDMIMAEFMSGFDGSEVPEEKTVVIFHCEFSAERGPRLMRFLRNVDRTKHGAIYPKLRYPEMYLLDGGYQRFFECRPDKCEPRQYVRMLDKNFAQEMKMFRRKTKSMNEMLGKGDRPGLKRAKSGLKF